MPDNTDTELTFTLYTRDNCHLCEQLLDDLKQQMEGRAYAIECIDIDSDSELQRLYGGRIPVLCHHQEILCEYFLDKEVLNRVLVANS